MKRKDFIKKSATGMVALAFSNTSFGMIKKVSQDEPEYFNFELNLDNLSKDVRARLTLNVNDQMKKGEEIKLYVYVEYMENELLEEVDLIYLFEALDDFKANSNLRIKHVTDPYDLIVKVKKADLDFTDITHLDTLFIDFTEKGDGKGKAFLKNSKSNFQLELTEYTPTCYLTTACVQHKSLPDNCPELTTLRDFRDTYMLDKIEGKKLVKEYYNTAPTIVKSIEKSEDKEEILDFIYDELVLKSINLIENNEHELAMRYYESFTRELGKRLLN